MSILLSFQRKKRAILESDFEKKICLQLSTNGRLRNGKKIALVEFCSIKNTEIPRSGAEKNFTQKIRFYTQKYQKNSMSKNGFKTRLTLLFKEL